MACSRAHSEVIKLIFSTFLCPCFLLQLQIQQPSVSAILFLLHNRGKVILGSDHHVSWLGVSMVDLRKTGSERNRGHQCFFLFVAYALVSPSPAVLLLQVLHKLADQRILELLTRTHDWLASDRLFTLGISLGSLVFDCTFWVDIVLEHTRIGFRLGVGHVIASAFTIEVCSWDASVVAGNLTFTDHARHQRLCCLYRFWSRLIHVRTICCTRVAFFRKLL